MARPLRIEIENGWYHVVVRGIEKRKIFSVDAERQHFYELLEEMVDRFGVVLHAFVQMTNHYHLLLQTPEANLSRAMQWLNVSYVAWFNPCNDRVGPLFQGRFKSIPVQDSAWAYELSMYIHLNPVMRVTYGLSKSGRKVASLGLVTPSAEMVTKRLAELRRYKWSSYRAYAGYVKAPDWLETREILKRAARKKADQVPRYREMVKQRLSKGVSLEITEGLKDGFALGTEAFRSTVREVATGGRELTGTRELRRKVSFDDVMTVVEELRGEKYTDFMSLRGDWARPLLLWSVRRFCGLTLKEIGETAGGMDYTAVAMAIKRFEEKAAKSRQLTSLMKKVSTYCGK